MAGFDEDKVIVSPPLRMEEALEDRRLDQRIYKTYLKDFLMHFREGQFGFKYRDQLRRNYNVGQYWVEVSVEDLIGFSEDLSDQIQTHPSEFVSVFEEVAKEVVDELTRPRPDHQAEIEDIQVMLVSDGESCQIREYRSAKISRLQNLHGIVTTASALRVKATKISLLCSTCGSVLPNIILKPGFDGCAIPRKCATNQGARAGCARCPMDSYVILPNLRSPVDIQILTLQESPEFVPSGEMPRQMTVYCERYLCDIAQPGNRITATGIYCVKKSAITSKNKAQKNFTGVQHPYFRILGIRLEMAGSARSRRITYTQQEKEQFHALAAADDCVERIVKSIAPSLHGHQDIKKAITCLLFGGSRKHLPDGVTRRGDINMLLLGDPGMGKSQLLKFVLKPVPIGIYTSGKGSSAVGLTASVNRDPVTGQFFVEAGAMVLADGGILCIDEFDKMREDDRVVLHEAMEQQTISIAKAGITTVLNSRCAVLAAGNSVFGRWDNTKGAANIDFMPTILSRFDLIFILKDEHNQERDKIMAEHVLNVHINGATDTPEQEGELSMSFLKKYIAYCKASCGPRLTFEASEILKNKYVLMRKAVREAEEASGRQNPIYLGVRQLEALVRLAESLAKMQLKPFATVVHVEEALRVFRVSTLNAASTEHFSGIEEFATQEDLQVLIQIETKLKRRMPKGTQLSERTIIEDFGKQKYDEKAIRKVLVTMITRGQLQYRVQRKMLFRMK